MQLLETRGGKTSSRRTRRSVDDNSEGATDRSFPGAAFAFSPLSHGDLSETPTGERDDEDGKKSYRTAEDVREGRSHGSGEGRFLYSKDATENG